MLQIPVRDNLNIHVIGAGGTGGYAIENIARLFAGNKVKTRVIHQSMVHSVFLINYKLLS